jgi:hypothetical protein
MSVSNERLDYARGLRAFQRIVDRGTRRDGAYCLGALRAWTDHDGYGITLSDGVVEARLLFHGRIAIAAPHRRALRDFFRRLEKLA